LNSELIIQIIVFNFFFFYNFTRFEGSYGFFQSKHDLNAKNFLSIKRKIYNDHYKLRKNAILWFVSNCKAKKRISIALEISKYYPIFIYGKCDILEDMNRKKINQLYPYLFIEKLKSENDCDRESKCEQELLASFKYFLAFENRNCTDYITEKIWRSLSKNLIPIVMQPSRESFYRNLIPEKSFIHLQDFNYNVKHLTDYLKELSNNFELYFNVLKWTNVYLKTINNQIFTEPHRMCKLCERLNTFKSNVYYKNIADFFNSKCLD
jgi:hypothetical protein